MESNFEDINQINHDWKKVQGKLTNNEKEEYSPYFGPYLEDVDKEFQDKLYIQAIEDDKSLWKESNNETIK